MSEKRHEKTNLTPDTYSPEPLTTTNCSLSSRGNAVDVRNPAPVDRWFIPLFIRFQPSKVVQDFVHPQHVLRAKVML